VVLVVKLVFSSGQPMAWEPCQNLASKQNMFHSCKTCFTCAKHVSLAPNDLQTNLVWFSNKHISSIVKKYPSSMKLKSFNFKKISFKYETKIFQIQNNSTTVKNCHVTFGTILPLSHEFWQQELPFWLAVFLSNGLGHLLGRRNTIWIPQSSVKVEMVVPVDGLKWRGESSWRP